MQLIVSQREQEILDCVGHDKKDYIDIIMSYIGLDYEDLKSYIKTLNKKDLKSIDYHQYQDTCIANKVIETGDIELLEFYIINTLVDSERCKKLWSKCDVVIGTKDSKYFLDFYNLLVKKTNTHNHITVPPHISIFFSMNQGNDVKFCGEILSHMNYFVSLFLQNSPTRFLGKKTYLLDLSRHINYLLFSKMINKEEYAYLLNKLLKGNKNMLAIMYCCFYKRLPRNEIYMENQIIRPKQEFRDYYESERIKEIYDGYLKPYKIRCLICNSMVLGT